MAANVIQADYERLADVAARFHHQSELIQQITQQVLRDAGALRDGGWQGRGAATFTDELEGQILPAMERLEQALVDARGITLAISATIQEAEEMAASPFGGAAVLNQVQPSAENSSQEANAGKDTGGFWGGVKDFFGGVYAEGKDMVVGLKNLVTDPIGTAKGLWHGITHPSELWDAVKQPYVEDWNQGRPMRAIGRGTMFAVSFLLGTKGADKAATGAKAARAARVAQEAAEIGTRFGNVTDDVARFMGTTANGSRAETAAARYIANQSSEVYRGALSDRVVLGPFKPDPATGFRGYIGEAAADGGRIFNTSPSVWATLKPGTGNNRIWSVNREFLQSQLEQGVPRIELRGTTIDDVLRNKPDSYAAQEVRFMQRIGYQYGYQWHGNSWVKVGEWRASTAGRGAGAAVGPGLDVVEGATQ